jgi:hypothetical protein
MEITKRIAGHYEVQQMPFGKVYQWSPERVVLKCRCGKNVTYNSSAIISSEVTRCECCKEMTATIREELIIKLLDELSLSSASKYTAVVP